MRIFKILNNNVAVVMDENGQEKIVMGRGICYKKKPGDAILEEEIDKTFFLSAADISNKFQELIQDIPIEHMAVGEEIIAEAERRLDKKLNDTVYISLIDHVHTSIVRFLEGVTVKNVLLWDIRRFYKEEFKIGLWALELIQEKCKVMLPEDEAGFIALHLANAQMDQESIHNMYEITRIIQEVVNLVKYYFKIDFHEDDVYYFRFITHLKFFAQRLVEQKVYTEDDIEDLWAVIRGKYPKSFDCVERFTKFIESKYKYHLSKEEQLYLTIHIERVVSKNRN